MKKTPSICVKNDTNFGYYGNLPKLTFLETLLITQTVVHMKLVKLKWGNQDHPSQSFLKGHCVCVSHTGLANTLDALPSILN